jgi:DNA-binding transcriptional MerR regulator
MRITEFAEKVGVHASTVRRYERAGLFHAQRDRQGHRRFGDDDVERFRKIFLPEQPMTGEIRP